MPPLRSDFSQRQQDEVPLVQSWMRECEFRFVQEEIVVGEKVQVDYSRSPADSFRRAAEVLLNSAQMPEEL